MNWELYAAFCVATAILTIIPGPTVGVITSTGLSYGVRPALLAVAGGIGGMAVHMTLVVVATASLFLFLDTAMPIIRWVGVAYLCFLGFEAFRRARASAAGEAPAHPRRHALFVRGFVVNVSNPKSLAFIAVFFPQFVDPSLAIGHQIAVMSVSYIVICGVIDTGWALMSGHVRWLFQTERARKWRERASGTAMFGAAVSLAALRPS